MKLRDEFNTRNSAVAVAEDLRRAIEKQFKAGRVAAFAHSNGRKHADNNAIIQPPGSPQMPVEVLEGMVKTTKMAFPDWVSVCLAVDENEDGTWSAYTQQQLGAIKGHMAAMDPFPSVLFDSAPELAKTTACVFPVEKGTYVFNAAGTKIVSASYDGTIVDDKKECEGYKVPTPQIVEWWGTGVGQRGYGFNTLYAWMGADLPQIPPPLEEI